MRELTLHTKTFMETIKMDFIDKMRQFSLRVASLQDTVQTEEATKTALVMPFFSMLGYDVFNPEEFVPEFTADVGIKKGEKVDYAIMQDGKPVILIECKKCGVPLEQHDSQLFRYFGTTTSKFAILTNGSTYRFFTDLEAPNKMDDTPFLELDLLNLDENIVAEVKKFCHDSFDIAKIFDTASELKYAGIIKKILRDEFSSPSDNFVRFILSRGVYEGTKTQNIIDKYSPLVKRALTQYINDVVNDKIQSALKSEDEKSPQFSAVEDTSSQLDADKKKASVVTTDEELQAFYIVRSLIRDTIPIDRVTYKDTINYFSIIIDEKVSKWICRLVLRENVKSVIFPNGNSNAKYILKSIDDLYNLQDKLCERAQDLL